MLKVANSVISASRITGVLPVANGGTGVTTSTGTGNTVLSATPTLSGDVTLSTGNLVIGTAGKGIDFSATSQAAGMTSELLADYEEGTWTPVATFDSGTITTVSYSSPLYTKIGREVTVVVYVTMTDSGTGTGALNISGLPFTSSSAPASIFGQEQANNGKGLAGYVNPTDTQLKRIRYADGLTVAAASSARDFSITAVYFV